MYEKGISSGAEEVEHYEGILVGIVGLALLLGGKKKNQLVWFETFLVFFLSLAKSVMNLDHAFLMMIKEQMSIA